jgi:TetR/AcrR family transcriptional regulator, transcriptional repressor for nem operon
VRYKPEHKASARQALLDAAARRLRIDGLTGIGVDGITRELGQTSGAFYAHYPSKAALFLDVVRDGTVRLLAGVKLARGDGRSGWLRRLTHWYLGPEHKRGIGEGCLMPSIGVDIARSDGDVKEAFHDGLEPVIREIAAGIEGVPPEEAMQRARATLALLVGSVILARAMPDDAAAEKILAAGRDASDEIARLGRRA